MIRAIKSKELVHDVRLFGKMSILMAKLKIVFKFGIFGLNYQ